MVLAVVILLAGGTAAFAYSQKKDSPQKTQETSKKTPADKSVGDISTKKIERGNKTIVVPKNVPESAIKDYELVTENETFKIRKLDAEYTITLYAIINSPDQSSQYRDQLKEYKQNALDYLSTKGVNTNTAKIKYEPEEATSL